uniref:Periplasmic solute binding protein n=1 Tax=uncultured organism TaxID=155900 RepID=M1P137_9ZZZZ|nr:periplasmic solute binding protein [uncultured organism]
MESLKNKLKITLITTTLLLSLTGTTNATQNQPTENNPTIVATSTNLGSFAEEIAGENIQITTIAPAGACPGHYDTRPGDVEAISQADLIIWGGFEPWLEDLVQNSGNTNVMKNKTPTGAWGPPPRAKIYVENIENALSAAFPQYEEIFEEKKENFLDRINSTAGDLQVRAEENNIENVEVICQVFQKPYVEWLGFNVVETFPSPEKVSASKTSELVETAEKENVTLIISNNASGTGYGEQIAAETGLEHVVLGNFPGWTKGVDTYIDLIESNAERLILGVKTHRNEQGEISDLEQDIDNIEIQRNAALTIALIAGLVAIIEFAMIRRG